MSKSNKEKPPDNESTEKTLSRRQIVTGLAALGAVATAASAPMLFPKENESTPKEPESLEVSDHAYEPDAIHCARQCSRIVPGDEVAQALLLICAPEKIAALIEPVSLDSSRSDSLTLDLPYFDGAGVYASPMKVSQYLNAFEAVSGDACDLILHVTLDGGGVSKEIRDRVTANAGAPGICLEGSFSQTEKLLSDFEQLFAVSRNDALHSLFSQVDEALGKAADIEQGSRFTMLPIGGSAGEVGHSEGTAVAKVLELAGVDRFDCRPSYYGTYEFDSVDLVEESAKADLALMLEESAYSDLLAGVISPPWGSTDISQTGCILPALVFGRAWPSELPLFVWVVMGAVWLSSSLYPESVLSAEETMASLLTEMGVTVPNSTTFAEESRSAYSEVGQLSPSEVREQRKAYIDNRQRLFDESLEQQSESALVTEDELEEARRAGEAERERRENEIAQRVSS